LLLGLPGATAALAAAAWRYGLSFHFGWSGVAAVLMTAVTATFIGYALGHASPSPTITAAVTQVFNFGILSLSPVFFPAQRLPDWLDRLNDFLPFEPMANVIRGAFTPEVADPVGASYVVLSVWLVATLTISAAVLGRRG
jgi:ABC-2 type transport system permease protein